MAECAKCSSPVLMEHVRVIDRGEGNSEQDLSVKAYRNPLALFFKGGVSSPLEATVCGACGYTELYAVDPKSLVAAVKESEERGKNKRR